MHFKILGCLAAIFIGLCFQPLEAKKHCRTQISVNIGSCCPTPYRESYVVREYYGPCYPCPAPRLYVRPMPPPPPTCYYEEVHVYPAPMYYYPYGW